MPHFTSKMSAKAKKINNIFIIILLLYIIICYYYIMKLFVEIHCKNNGIGCLKINTMCLKLNM